MPWGQGGAWGTPEVWGTIPEAPTLVAMSPTVVDRLGGTLVTLYGTYFQDPMTIEILDNAVPTVVGLGYYSNARYDLAPGTVVFGTPPLDPGTYRVRVSTVSGQSGILSGLVVKTFADEDKVVRMRSKWAALWRTGSRYLMGG